MKHIFTLSILLILLNSAIACSCSYFYSFCNSHTSHDLTACCVIVDTFPNGMSLEVLHIWNGNENRDTITVWDLGGPYDLCNDSLSDVTRVSYLGSIGDTIIVALPRVDTIKNAWDVVGDYRIPGFICWEYKLTVINNLVKGFISGSEFCYLTNDCLLSYDYDSFVVDFPVNSLSCESWLDAGDLSSGDFLNYYPNPATKEVYIETNKRGNVRITNSSGQLVNAVSIQDDGTKISTDGLPSGVYFMTFNTERTVVTKKLIIQH